MKRESNVVERGICRCGCCGLVDGEDVDGLMGSSAIRVNAVWEIESAGEAVEVGGCGVERDVHVLRI